MLESDTMSAELQDQIEKLKKAEDAAVLEVKLKQQEFEKLTQVLQSQLDNALGENLRLNKSLK